MEHIGLKPFTVISKEASLKPMCWNLTCTTCGSVELMDLFRKSANIDTEVYRYSHSNKLEIQKQLLTALQDIDIVELMENSQFPDYLGHIGLLLSACESAENKYQIISENIYKQMLELYPNELFLINKVKEKAILNIKDFSIFEDIIKKGFDIKYSNQKKIDEKWIKRKEELRKNKPMIGWITGAHWIGEFVRFFKTLEKKRDINICNSGYYPRIHPLMNLTGKETRPYSDEEIDALLSNKFFTSISGHVFEKIDFSFQKL